MINKVDSYIPLQFQSYVKFKLIFIQTDGTSFNMISST